MKNVKFLKGTTVEFKFAYDKTIIEAIKLMNGRKYVPENRSWQVKLSVGNVVQTEEIINKHKFMADLSTLKLIKEIKVDLKEFVEFNYNEVPILKVPKTVKAQLRPYQIEGFSYMVHKKSGAMNGCDMGLGKTLQTLVAIEYLNAYPALIICPASLKYNWKNEIIKFLPNRSFQLLDSKSFLSPNIDFYIINYESLEKKYESLNKISFQSCACDESHKVKNSKAKRTQFVKKLIKDIPVRYLISGTPIENRPSELIGQMKILDKLDEFGGYWGYINRYCNAYRTPWGLNINGASNLEELHDRLRQSFYFRKNKSDVLTELPDKEYVKLNFEITNWTEYIKAQEDLVSYLQTERMSTKEFKTLLKTLSQEEQEQLIDLKAAQIEEGTNAAQHLVMLNTLRQISAKGKLKPTIEWIENFLEETNEKILVFAHHQFLINSISEHFMCNKIDGSVSLSKRNEYVNDFQENADSRILVLNINAGGVGLNLTAATNVFFVEQTWTPSSITQAEDRAHRIGQKNNVIIYTAVGEGTVDESIYNLIKEKSIVTNAVNAGKIDSIENRASIMQQVLDILSKIS